MFANLSPAEAIQLHNTLSRGAARTDLYARALVIKSQRAWYGQTAAELRAIDAEVVSGRIIPPSAFPRP
jgi:hypothetical protein